MSSARIILRGKKVKMEVININVPKEFSTQEIDKLYAHYKKYRLEVNEHIRLFQHMLATVRAQVGNTKIGPEV